MSNTNKMYIELPIYWVNEKKTKKSTTHLAGDNFFRNAHYYIKNKMKKDFEDIVFSQKYEIPNLRNRQFKTHYRLYYKNTNSDGSNVIHLIEKFYLDALSKLNKISNDNVKYHIYSSWEVVEQDKEFPRVEITVEAL